MATRADSHSVKASPDEVAWLVDQVRTFGSAAAAAKAVGLERTMVWRVTTGRNVSRANLLEIKKRREMAFNVVPASSEPPAQTLSVAVLRSTLQLLLQALDGLERDERAETPRSEK